MQILGSGYAKCKKLAEHAEAAAQTLGIDYEMEKVTGLDDILSYGVMNTPALVVDGEVKVAGRVPTVDAIKAMIA